MQPLRLRFGVVTSPFQQTLKQKVKTVADMGADGLQFDALHELKPADLTETGRKQFLHLLSEVGLKIDSLHVPTRRTLWDLEHLDARIAAIKATLEFAYQLQTKVVTLRIGRIPEDPAAPEFQTLRPVLAELASYSNRIGASLAIIPTQDSAAELHKLVNGITEGFVGIDFDPASFVLSGQKPAESLRTLHASVLHIQARDAIREVFGAGQEVPLGRGEVEWSEFAATIDEISYQGWITANRTQGEDRGGDLANAVLYLKEVFLR